MAWLDGFMGTQGTMKTYHDIMTDGGSDVEGQVAERTGRLADRLAGIARVVAVMSGKGGVGKSTVAVNLAATLAREGARVGLVDADINGPSLGRMTGVRATPLCRDGSAFLPAQTSHGIRVMSMALFFQEETAPIVWDAPSQAGAVAWRGLREAGALRELIADTAWGELDLLLVDLPPGPDRLPAFIDVVPRVDGVLVITLPSAVSVGIVGRSIRIMREHGVAAHTMQGHGELTHAMQEHPNPQAMAIIENMASRLCPHCGGEDPLYPVGSVDRLARALDVPVIARIPFDPAVGLAADEGRSYPHEHPDRPAARAYAELADRLRAFLHAGSWSASEPPRASHSPSPFSTGE